MSLFARPKNRRDREPCPSSRDRIPARIGDSGAANPRVSVRAGSMAVDARTSERLPRRILAGLLVGVRRSDGQFVSYRNDGVALGLYLSGLALFVAALLVGWLSQDVGSWWLWALLLVGLTAQTLAGMRLRRSVRTAEGFGAVMTLSLGARLMNRACEFMARRCDIAADKLLARSAQAEARGDQQSADQYRSRADREHERAERCRSLPGEKLHKRNQRRSDEVPDRCSGSVGVAESTVWVAHEAAEDATGDSGWLDGLDALDGLG